MKIARNLQNRLTDRLDRSHRWFRVDPPGPGRQATIEFFSLVAVAMIGLPVAIHAVATAGFIVGRPIGPGTIPVAWVVCAIGLALIARRTIIPRPLLVSAVLMLIQIAVLGMAVAGLGKFYDLSFDGQWFNQEAVLVLESGWDPLMGPATADEATEIGARSKVNGYTKASWICDAAVVSMTGRIEDGKALDPLLFIAAMAAAAAAVLCVGRVSVLGALFVGLLVAINPTAMNQLTTHMVDGELGWGLAVLASGLVIMIVGPMTNLAVLTAALGLVWTIGTKFSGAPMAAGLLLSALVISLVVNRHRVTARRVAALAGAAAIAVLLNANPLITNALWFDHPFYPYYGPQRTDVRFSGGQGGFTAMAMSMASRATRKPNLEESHRELMTGSFLEWPFHKTLSRLVRMRMPSAHIGGWGPLFSSMMLLGIAVLVVESRARPPSVIAATLVVVAIITSSLVIQYPWVARYVPQTWWIPLVILPVAMTSRRRLTRALGWSLAALALSAGVITSILHLQHSAQATARTKRQLAALGENGEPIAVHYGFFQSNRRRLSELGIDAHEVSDRSYSIDVVVGRKRARFLGHRTVGQPSGNGQRLVLRWVPDPRATFHRITLTQLDDSAPTATQRSIELESPRARTSLPIEKGRWRIGVSGCNSLGCGPEDLIETDVDPSPKTTPP